ncbi:hypothetical protein EH196_04060 [Bacillus sp. C1-1]|nr:hypothetical protein EH196_04060 [Bacillus sp. C1-1]
MSQFCPICEKPFTEEDLYDAKIAFSFKCRGCQSRVYEVKTSLLLLIPALGFAGLLIFLSEQIREWLLPILPFIENWPIALIAIVFLFPIYYFGENTLVKLTYKHGKFFSRKKRVA